MEKVVPLMWVVIICAASQVMGADLQKGIDAINKFDYATTLEELKPLAEQGDGEAQNSLGDMYAEGKGVTQDGRL